MKLGATGLLDIPHGNKWIFPQRGFGVCVCVCVSSQRKGVEAPGLSRFSRTETTAQRKLFANILWCEWDLQQV